MKHWILLAVLVTFLLLMVGCAAHTHVIGDGGQETQVNARQWYILWGLVPINNVDTQQMADGADNYTVHTRQSFLDILIGIPASIITVNSRTVSVTK